jgi:hypothetical protein
VTEGADAARPSVIIAAYAPSATLRVVPLPRVAFRETGEEKRRMLDAYLLRSGWTARRFI